MLRAFICLLGKVSQQCEPGEENLVDQLTVLEELLLLLLLLFNIMNRRRMEKCSLSYIGLVYRLRLA